MGELFMSPGSHEGDPIVEIGSNSLVPLNSIFSAADCSTWEKGDHPLPNRKSSYGPDRDPQRRAESSSQREQSLRERRAGDPRTWGVDGRRSGISLWRLRTARRHHWPGHRETEDLWVERGHDGREWEAPSSPEKGIPNRAISPILQLWKSGASRSKAPTRSRKKATFSSPTAPGWTTSGKSTPAPKKENRRRGPGRPHQHLATVVVNRDSLEKYTGEGTTFVLAAVENFGIVGERSGFLSLGLGRRAAQRSACGTARE